MRVSREQAQENKRAILRAAGRLFRSRGFESVTVAEVMKSAGFTHGGFYCYFKSKDDLVAQAMAGVLGALVTHEGDLAAFARQYLSPGHRDDLAGGCPMAALASESGRQLGGARTEMTAGLRCQLERLSRIAPGSENSHKRRVAIGSWAAMVGALILSRMSDDSDLSDEILRETEACLAGAFLKAPSGRHLPTRPAGGGGSFPDDDIPF
jgi:TetR/AcrR family transcriptional repressor of nem operon